MQSGNVRLNRAQIEFLVYMTEIKDIDRAVEKFVTILLEERADPSQIVLYINKLMEKKKNAHRK